MVIVIVDVDDGGSLVSNGRTVDGELTMVLVDDSWWWRQLMVNGQAHYVTTANPRSVWFFLRNFRCFVSKNTSTRRGYDHDTLEHDSISSRIRSTHHNTVTFPTRCHDLSAKLWMKPLIFPTNPFKSLPNLLGWRPIDHESVPGFRGH